MIIGSLVFAIGLSIFTTPNNIIIGGATGLGTIINHLINIPIGFAIWLVNVPLYLLSLKFAGKRFTIRTFIGSTILSITIDIFDIFVKTTYTSDKVLATVFGGTLMGIGLYLIMQRGILTGGSDLAAFLIQRKFGSVSISKIILIIDSVVVALGSIVYKSFDTALYSTLLIIIYSFIIDYYLKEKSRAKVAYIFSKEPQKVLEEVIKTLGHSATILEARGGFSGDNKKVLMCAVFQRQSELLKRLVLDIDKDAFIIITEATEVLGIGFKEPNENEIR